MWSHEGREVPRDALGSLRPEEILFEFEEPLTFVCRDRDDQWLLAHNLGLEGMVSRYLVVVTDERILDELKAGVLDLRGALRQPRCWIADVGPVWNVERVWIIPFSKVPARVLPRPGALLTPDLVRPDETAVTGGAGLSE